MILWIFFCLPTIAVVLGESQPRYGQAAGYEAESLSRKIVERSNRQDDISEPFFDPESEEEAERETPRRGGVDPEVADQLEGNGWLDVIPGTPGKDYPNYERIPKTSFTCEDKTPGGYYADIEARCQVFHVCDTGGHKSSFLCPSGSIFNQKYFVCDWWYDFECDDASDLYSLNEKVNRGGTGSGPSGPGRIEEEIVDYPSEDRDFPVEELQNQGNFVSSDGFDLSLAGTGEGGPGYARNGNKKGYQSNVDDEDDRGKEKKNGNQGTGARRKSFSSRRTSGDLSKLDYSPPQGNKREENSQFPVKERPSSQDESPKGFSSGSGKDREKEFAALSDVRGGGEPFRKENLPAGNPGVNYQPGYEVSNPNGPPKTNNFRPGRRAEQSNRFNENSHNPGEHPSANRQNRENSHVDYHPQRNTQKYENDGENRDRSEKRNNFGQRSSIGKPPREYLASKNPENNYNRGSSSRSEDGEFSNFEAVREEQRTVSDQGDKKNQEFHEDGPSAAGPEGNEYRSSSDSGPANIRGRQRTGGRLSGGLGNGYPSPGRARELPGSDAIAGGITQAAGEKVYDEGDQRSSNFQHRTSSSGSRNFGEATDSQKIGPGGNRDQNLQRFDFRDDNYPPGSEHTSNGQSSRIQNYSAPNSSSRNENFFDSKNRESNGQTTDQDHQSSGNNYLLGIVPGMDDRGNGTSGSNQPRRYLPIL